MPSSYTPPVNLAAPGPIGATTPAAITGTALTATAKLVVPNGTAGAPSIIGVDTDTGINFAEGALYLTTDAAARLTITSGSCYSVVPFFGPSGSAGSPAFGYNVDGSGLVFDTATLKFFCGVTERARLTAGGLNIGATGAGTNISASNTFTKAVSDAVTAGTVSSQAITATGIVAGDVVSQIEMTAIQPASLVIQSVRCGTDIITVDFYNSDLLAPHSLTGTIKVRSFKA